MAGGVKPEADQEIMIVRPKKNQSRVQSRFCLIRPILPS